MNKRFDDLMYKAGLTAQGSWDELDRYDKEAIMRFAYLIVEDVLNEVKERAYYTGDRDWSDEVDRPWIQLVYEYGKLADAKKGIFK